MAEIVFTVHNHCFFDQSCGWPSNDSKLVIFKLRAGLGTVGIVVGITLLTYLNFFDITKVKLLIFISWCKSMMSVKIWQIIFLIPLAMLFTWIWFPIFGYSNALYTFYCSLGVAAAALFLAFGNYVFEWTLTLLKSVPPRTSGSI